ncbi:hypothetical protein BEH94_09840 [Candidatus Altiarchaeales archaeon WOR_SM1_SCG]|nr:hypothetical protein BEH94_09840 [Candidatus Altiarchaeales archaeon WOR_SM1_SCG]
MIFQEATGLQTEIIYVTADTQTHFFNITLNVSKDINDCMKYDIDNNNTINFVELKYFYKCYIGINNDPGCPVNILQNKTVMDLIKICFDIDNPEFINHPSTVTISEPVFNIYPEQEQEQEQIQNSNSNSKTLYAESEPQPKKQPETHKNINNVIIPEPQTFTEKPLKNDTEQQTTTHELTTLNQEKIPTPTAKIKDNPTITKNNTTEPDFIIEKIDQENNENYLFLIILISICILVICYLIYSIIKIRYA